MSHTWKTGALAALTALALGVPPAVADDGEQTRKRMSHDAKDSTQPIVPDAEHAFVGMMKFYVPAQMASGGAAPGDYLNADGALVGNRTLAKPLVGVYIKGPVYDEGLDGLGFVGHGKRDAWAAVSLDDGVTWKQTNLSDSAGETSCDAPAGTNSCSVLRTDVPLFADTDFYYPGDVINVFHAIMGNKVLVAWPSRYCASGQPNYSLDKPDYTDKPELLARRNAIAAYLGIDLATASPDDLYLVDMFGVGGSQGAIDYTGDKFPQNAAVKQVPFSCLWTARGELVKGDDPRTADVVEQSYMRWFKAERLTSGARDVNRIETMCVAGAGCAITWQEDPDGLRAGQGEGPGEGWSGAVANSGTDVWYSYIEDRNFDLVQDPLDPTGATSMTLAAFELAATAPDATQKPKPFVPFAMPMRLTDNAKCNVANPKPYCNGSAIAAQTAITNPDVKNPLAYGMRDMCKYTIQIPTGPDDTLKDVCVTESGLPLVGNTAATRPRLGLYGYRSDGKVADSGFDSAFVVVVAEEDKGLGAFGFTADGTACTPDKKLAPDCIPFDEGKNIWYFSFSMSLRDTLGGGPRLKQDGLLANLTSHGSILNQPEVDWRTGEFYPVRNTASMWNFGAFNYDIYGTEIARRGSLLAQDFNKVFLGNRAQKATSKAKGRLVALPTWKQGIMNQGGPADVMSRRILMPAGWTLWTHGNPYAFRYMACSNWAYHDDTTFNPYYPGGICLDPAINLSATIPDSCQDSQTGAAVECPKVDLAVGTFGVGNTNPILQGLVQQDGNTTKVLSWHQCPASFTTARTSDGTPPVDCATDWRTDATTLRDQSWYNPLDVAKGHRGFIDGDFVMMLYAWSPNWRLNRVGHDRYDLYIRRSFDGGQTWTTLPAGYTHWDGSTWAGTGTVSCQSFRSEVTGTGEPSEPKVCYGYPAGVGEQGRNVTQMKSTRTTTLDPRFALAGSPQGVSNTSNLFGFGVNPYGEDVRNPSRYFVVYETGDNTTTAEGEPESDDLFYSRAVAFGDRYQVWAEDSALADCYPSNPHGDLQVSPVVAGSGFCNEFDQLDQGTKGLQSSEASLTANPGGQFMYGVWAQWDESTGVLTESDAMARRTWWIDQYIPLNAWLQGSGGNATVP